MISRSFSFLVSAMLIGIPAAVALADDVGEVVTTDKAEVCSSGYDKARRALVTYAGLVPMHGYQRDHEVPICLGGADTPSNVHYQPLDEAHEKDQLERLACRAVCDGRMSLEHAQSMFLGGDWKDSYREVFGKEP